MKVYLVRAAAAALSLVFACTVASAHVVLETPQAAVGGGYKAVFNVPHGCEGSPTIEVRIDVPEGVIGVKPMPKPGWTLSLSKGPYARSYAFYHGRQISEGVRQVTWSGGSLPDEYFDQFVLSTVIAGELQPGRKLAFPVTQKCESGEVHWSKVAAEGQDAHAFQFPAPQLTLTAAAAVHDHSAQQTPAAANGIAIEAPWSRPVGAGTTVAVGYLKISNGGREPDILLGGSSEVAERVELHETTTGEDGVARMRKLDGLEIKPGASVELKPLGAHLMLIGVKGPLEDGGTFKVRLNFQKAGAVDVEFAVKAAGAGEPQALIFSVIPASWRSHAPHGRPDPRQRQKALLAKKRSDAATATFHPRSRLWRLAWIPLCSGMTGMGSPAK